MQFRNLCSLAVVAAAVCLSAPAPAASGDGSIELSVDVSQPARHIMRVSEKIPVQAGALTLYYPKYIPGEHGPTGPIVNVAGLVFEAGGKRLAWQRDPVDMYAFHLDVPPGVDTLDVKFDFLSPVGGGAFTAGVSMTPKIVDLEWNQVALYPAGQPTRKLTYDPSITLPAGWSYASALSESGRDGATVHFAPVTFNNLVDSPLIAGENFRQVDLAPGDSVHRYLDMVADYPQALDIGSDYTADFRALIEQADALFGSHHYDDYHFLLTLSDHTGHFGLEHHQSSDDRINADLFLNKETMLGEASLLPHEYVHSWNGKFRRPAKLWQPDFEQPEHTGLLWVYEGLTNYWGEVLAARSGLWSAQDYRDMLAYYAANMSHRPGRAWRPLGDTTVAAQLLYGAPDFYSSWRRGTDFYDEGALIWLGVDAKIRQLTNDKRSLDDFARAFYGMDDGSYVTQTYTFDDVVKTLDSVAPFDWAGYLKRRIEEPRARAPLGGVTGSGWKLVYSAVPNPYEEARETIHHFTDATYSIGLSVERNGRIRDVLWNGPAFAAGLAPGMKIVAIDGDSYGPNVLQRAIAATGGKGKTSLTVTAKGQGVVRDYTIRYADGLRYPHLEREGGVPDYLSEIVAPKKD